MKNHAFIFDIDGTAINSPSQKLPSKLLVDVIGKLKDRFYFSSATGRVWSFAKPILKELKLTDPCIISAGTQICDPMTGNILWQKVIPDESLRMAIKIFQQNPNYKLLYNDATENDYFFGGIKPDTFKVKDPVYFLEQVFVPDGIAIELFQKLNALEGVTCVMVVSQRSGCRDLHVINKDATKEHAVVKLLELLKVNIKNTTGFGDGHNDIHLFNAVHQKIAVGNAVPELKEKADLVIGSAENDGLAKYLQTLII